MMAIIAKPVLEFSITGASHVAPATDDHICVYIKYVLVGRLCFIVIHSLY